MVTGRIEPCIRWDGVEVKKWGAVQKIMHLSMLSPRVGRAGPPREIDLQGCPLGRDFEHKWCHNYLTFREKVTLGAEI